MGYVVTSPFWNSFKQQFHSLQEQTSERIKKQPIESQPLNVSACFTSVKLSLGCVTHCCWAEDLRKHSWFILVERQNNFSKFRQFPGPMRALPTWYLKHSCKLWDPKQNMRNVRVEFGQVFPLSHLQAGYSISNCIKSLRRRNPHKIIQSYF